jgi:ribonuclease P protein component
MSNIKKRYKYGGAQRLKSMRTIDNLFKEGKSIQQFPLRLVWLPVDSEQKLQVGVAASKRFFAKAVQRNYIKRHLREAWRLQKNCFEEEMGTKELCVAAMIIFTGKELKDVALIPIAMQKIISKFSQEIEKL